MLELFFKYEYVVLILTLYFQNPPSWLIGTYFSYKCSPINRLRVVVCCMQKSFLFLSNSQPSATIGLHHDYLKEHGTLSENLIVGFPAYGHTFILSDPSNTGIGAPTISSDESGLWAYYEISRLAIECLVNFGPSSVIWELESAETKCSLCPGPTFQRRFTMSNSYILQYIFTSINNENCLRIGQRPILAQIWLTVLTAHVMLMANYLFSKLYH